MQTVLVTYPRKDGIHIEPVAHAGTVTRTSDGEVVTAAILSRTGVLVIRTDTVGTGAYEGLYVHRIAEDEDYTGWTITE